MPELPEVETIVQDLLVAGLLGIKIEAAQIFWPKTIAGVSPAVFCSKIQGKKVVSITRRAKLLVWTLSDRSTLFIHLRMTGRFSFEQGPHARVVLKLSDGRELVYHDARKFGRWSLVDDPLAFTQKYGPEPLDPAFTESEFRHRLGVHKRKLKPLLLDQAFIAGLGNIYVDEALWEAGLHPLRMANSLSPTEAKTLFKAIRTVLKRGLTRQGTSLGKGKSNFYRLDGSQGSHQDLMQVFRRTGLPCPRCGSSIQRLVVGQRSTHFCPTCQQFSP